jgi:hypothetical protein
MHVDGNDIPVAGPDQSDATIDQPQFGRMPIMSEHFAETELP